MDLPATMRATRARATRAAKVAPIWLNWRLEWINGIIQWKSVILPTCLWDVHFEKRWEQRVVDRQLEETLERRRELTLRLERREWNDRRGSAFGYLLYHRLLGCRCWTDCFCHLLSLWEARSFILSSRSAICARPKNGSCRTWRPLWLRRCRLSTRLTFNDSIWHEKINENGQWLVMHRLCGRTLKLEMVPSFLPDKVFTLPP